MNNMPIVGMLSYICITAYNAYTALILGRKRWKTVITDFDLKCNTNIFHYLGIACSLH